MIKFIKQKQYAIFDGHLSTTNSQSYFKVEFLFQISGLTCKRCRG